MDDLSKNIEISKSTSIWARAVRTFEQDKADVLVGAYKGEVSTDVIYSSFHLDYEYPLHAFTRDNETLRRFENKDVSLTLCLTSGTSLLKHVEFVKKENVIEALFGQCDKLIKNNKVDVVVEYDYNLAQSTLALPKVQLVENSPLFLVFHNTLKGHYLKEYFDKNMIKLTRTGELKKLFPDEISFEPAHIRP